MSPPNGPVADPQEPHVLRTPVKDSPWAGGPGTGGDTGGDNIVDLLRQLVGQGSHLAEQQMSLMKAEVREAATDVKTSVAGFLGAAVVGIAGLGVVLMGLAYLLADAIDNLGWATLIVGVVTLALAYALYRSAAAKLNTAHLAPERTERTLARTPDVARGNLHTEQER